MMIDGHNGTGVTIKKVDLLGVLKKNRDAHRGVFIEAQKGFREEAIRLLDSHLQDAREGRRILLEISIPEPQDHTKDYDRAIRMLEMCTKEEIFISEHEFSCYVEDDWGWKEQFVGVTNNYTGRR
jgi:hypothetical protein